MSTGTLAERLEHAILETVLEAGGHHQDSWVGWEYQIAKRGVDVRTFTPANLLSALKHLQKRGLLSLTKPDPQRTGDSNYSADETDDALFFHQGVFNAVASDKGRSHWNTLRQQVKAAR